MTQDATIYALASGVGRAAVAIVRVSGPAAGEALLRLTGRLPPPRAASLASLRHPSTGELLDQALALYFPSPQSFTGEDCAELQLHGSRAVVASVLAALAALPGLRLAEPGEFTRRAFFNGKLDLAAVEGLADLIYSETEAQRRQALRQLGGDFGRWAERLRGALIEASALAEAAIDFADEGDIAETVIGQAMEAAGQVGRDIRRELDQPRRAERIRDGFVITLAGPPNAGKSTLLNALARREAAIVSPHAGTTRDPIEVALDLGGFAVMLIDTAGIRESGDPVEQEGVTRARARAAQADLVLWLQDGAERPAPPPGLDRVWTIGTKVDLLSGEHLHTPVYDHLLSAATGQGVAALVERVTTLVSTDLAGGDAGLITQVRHASALRDAADAIRRAEGGPQEAELLAEELRTAARAIGRISGRIDAEDVLGAVFARFCVGK